MLDYADPQEAADFTNWPILRVSPGFSLQC